MGVLTYLSELYSDFTDSLNNKKEKKQFQMVEIKIRLDCEGCEKRARHSVKGMKGVTKVEVEAKESKLTVYGFVDPKKVLKRVRRKTKKAAVMWPYVKHDLVYHPYIAGAYDKKAPPGYVRNVNDDPNIGQLARASSLEERYATAFSDENPNSCNVM
ncbi:heavy metal-associated isoprenylated plant protein 27 [Dendrobium catenatum]|uniref:Heavy metal-associated isoprenylated plant protein 26 n=1 Tax=Dendrobium catenatum TaxID=906689 RepID=A0A2I0WR72_9ASPA|nr:heavy metal-associated isoprenylated plant protein 27 [Dendrobium catenatum]PKU78162.1 Heavy metal-associated isoprenylated plant protein 26 [Dendrobium catenatum]